MKNLEYLDLKLGDGAANCQLQQPTGNSQEPLASFHMHVLWRILLIEFQCQQYFGLLCYYHSTAALHLVTAIGANFLSASASDPLQALCVIKFTPDGVTGRLGNWKLCCNALW